MTTVVVLLRAVNVGGTGKLPMADLRALAGRAGFGNPETYIASGNLIVDAGGERPDDDVDRHDDDVDRHDDDVDRHDENDHPGGAAETRVAEVMSASLADYAGRPVGVVVRTPAELGRVLAANPFPDAPGNRVAVVFLPGDPPPDVAESVTGATAGEKIVAGERCLYVHYPNGQGTSKLRLPASVAAEGTARNLNTVAKLVALCAERAAN